MEKLVPKLFNLNFEETLKNPFKKELLWKPINGELEHLLFWVQKPDDLLFTHKIYEKSYLEYLESFIGYLPKTTTNGDQLTPWWGHVTDQESWELERRLNSKVETAENRKELNLEEYPSYICHSQAEVSRAKDQITQKYVIKEEFNFSGKGLNFESSSRKLEFPCIVEPWVKRVRDFSVYISDETFYVLQSQIDKKGAYKGGYIKPSFSEEPLLREKAIKIWEFYKKKYTTDFLQIDAFQFLDDSKLKLNSLGEINHRQSLGQIFYKLHQRFGATHSFMGLIPSRLLKNEDGFKDFLERFQKYQYNPVTKTGVFALSSGKEHFSVFFFTEQSERTLQFLIRDWWRQSIRENQRLPSEFIIYL